MTGELTAVMRELGEIQDQIAALAHGTVADRRPLLLREQRLQNEVARLAEQVDDEWDTQGLLVHLAELRRKKAALDRQHGGVGGTRPDDTPSRMWIERRTSRVIRILNERGIELR